MNRIHEVGEGRPIWKLRPMMLLITLVLVALAAAVLVALVLTGPAAEAVGSAIGRRRHRRAGVEHRQVAGAAAAVVVLMVAILFYSTPNVRAAEVPLDLGRRRAGDPGLGAGLGGVRLLRRQLLQLRQDLRLAGRRHRLPAVAVADQPRPALRCRARLRARAGPRAAGRAAGRGAAAAAAARHPQHREGRRRSTRRTWPSAAPCARATAARTTPTRWTRETVRGSAPTQKHRARTDDEGDPMKREERTSTSARILYRPVGHHRLDRRRRRWPARSSSRCGSGSAPARAPTPRGRWSRSTPMKEVLRRRRGAGRRLRGRQGRRSTAVGPAPSSARRGSGPATETAVA